MGRGDDTKSFVPFQGFALCVCVWWQIFPRARSREYLSTPTAAPAHWQAEKEQNQKAAVGGKKNRLFAGTKRVVVGSPSPATRSPSPALPKGRESILAVFEGV